MFVTCNGNFFAADVQIGAYEAYGLLWNHLWTMYWHRYLTSVVND
jgi:hypothetical protein